MNVESQYPFAQIESELTSIVETFQAERATQKREIEHLKQMVQQRDILIQQLQSDHGYEKERIIHQYKIEKGLHESTMVTLTAEQGRLKTEIADLKSALKKRESDLRQLESERANWMEEIQKLHKKKDDHR